MSKEQIAAIAQMLAAGRPEGEPTVEEMRAGMEAMTGVFPVPEGAAIEPGSLGGVAGEWQSAEGAGDNGVLLYFHGGGYVLGSVGTHRNLVVALSGAAGIKAFSVEYRLAPEHPYPAGIEDAVAAYRGLLDSGVEPSKIAVGGDSAGGGMTLALLLSIKQQGLPQPACAVLLSPWSDLRLASEAYETRREADPMVTREGLQAMADHYLGETDPAHPLASPILADLSGLAPMLIHVGDAEILLNDSTDLAEKAKAVGADATLKVWDDMIHVFQAFFPMVDEGRESIAEIGAYIRDRIG